MLKKIIVFFIALFLVVQFFQPEKTNPEVKADLQADLSVKQILKNSCYDCHSNETTWPWYSYIMPTSIFISDHVEHGRKHLNFSDWENLDSSKKAKMQHEIWEEIEKGEMPLSSYLILHPNSELTKENLDTIKAWADSN